MRYAIAGMAMAAMVTIAPAAFAAPAPQAKAPASSQTKEASHATTGVVKSFDATSLVITRSGKQKGEMTFELSPSTHRDGTMEVGAPVSVRYREEGKNHIATAITVQRPKQQTAAHAATAAK